MENDDDQEERWRLDDHKLKRLVQYYFPATLESPTRSQIIWLWDVKVIYGVEMNVNLYRYKKTGSADHFCDHTKNRYVQKCFPSGMSKRTQMFLVECLNRFLMAFMVGVSKTNSNYKILTLACFVKQQRTHTIFPISSLPDGNRLQKLNTKRQRINRSISGGAIVKMGFLSNTSVDKWRE